MFAPSTMSLAPEARLEIHELRAARARDRAPEDGAPGGDQDLAERARAGDRVAFGRLYERHARFVHGLLLACVPAREAADLVQEVFLSALRSIGSLSEPARFAPWLGSIARNRARDALRRQALREGALEHDLPATESATNEVEGRASAELIALVRELPEAYRETLVLRLVEGHSGPEIAARTGLTHGSVRVNLHRGMRLLRERLRGRSGS